MKFELEPYHRNISDKELIEDLRRVASKLKKNSVTIKAYDKHGKFHSTTLRHRIGNGSWFKVLEKAGLQKTRNLHFTEKELLDDLIQVSKLLKKDLLTFGEYKINGGKFSYNPFARIFGSWLKALEKAGLKKSRNYGITEEQYFENIQDVWIKLGRQPYYSDMRKPLSKYVGGAYERRFGTWRKALEKFIKWVNTEETSSKKEEKTPLMNETESVGELQIRPKTKREPNLRLRFIVMKRDNFTCQHCGWSPAKRPDPKLELQVDHRIPWPKGETVLENLQTLCSTCNIGKSNLEI